MRSKFSYWAAAAVGLAVAGALAWWIQQPPRASSAVGLAPTAAGKGVPVVEAATVRLMALVDDAEAVGSLRSRQSVVLRPEVSGRIARLNFRDGDRVRKGQLLVQLDDQLPQAQLQQSLAELSIAQANHRRNQELVAQNFISQRSIDESAAALQVAQAKLALARATAERLRIVAPFDGIAGIGNVSVGDYLKDGTDIVNLEDLDAMYVDFRLPERYQGRVRRGQQAQVRLDALPGQDFSALILAVDPRVDPSGRSIGVRGCIDNRAMALRPGMFARVTTVFARRADARVIPEEAVVPQGGRQFVVQLVEGPDRDSVVTRRVAVQLGLRTPGWVEVVQGLQPGDRIVTAGHQRLQADGMAVRVLDAAQDATPPAPPPGVAEAEPAGAAAARRPGGPNPCALSRAAG